MCYTCVFTHIWAESKQKQAFVLMSYLETVMAWGKKPFCDGVLQAWTSNDFHLKYPVMDNIILGIWCEWLWLEG